MKNHIKTIAALTILTTLSIGCNEQTIISSKDTSSPSFNDPVIKRADIVFDESTGLTPTVVRTATGDLIAIWGTRGDGMPGQASQMARSSDNGKTWSKPYLTIKPEKPLTGLMTALYALPDSNWTTGRLLRYRFEILWTDEPSQSKSNFGHLTSKRKFDSYYSISDDGGKTFGEEKLLSDPDKRNDFSQGNIVTLPNGDLIWPWGYWGANPLNGFKRSTDGGLSWGPVIRAWQDPPPGQDKPLAFNETAVAVCKDGSIVAVARIDSLLDKKFWQIKSYDNGNTWTKPRQIEIAGGSPAMYCTPKGQLWLAYRDGGFGPGLGLAVSDDNGDTWRFLYHLKDPKGEHQKLYGHIRYTDEDRKKKWRPAEGMVGYPCFQKLSETEVYVVYHAHNRSEMVKLFPEFPFYIAGNLLQIPKTAVSKE